MDDAWSKLESIRLESASRYRTNDDFQMVFFLTKATLVEAVIFGL